jgi:hypothetical protein
VPLWLKLLTTKTAQRKKTIIGSAQHNWAILRLRSVCLLLIIILPAPTVAVCRIVPVSVVCRVVPIPIVRRVIVRIVNRTSNRIGNRIIVRISHRRTIRCGEARLGICTWRSLHTRTTGRNGSDWSVVCNVSGVFLGNGIIHCRKSEKQSDT